jgi:hypothetical protein
MRIAYLCADLGIPIRGHKGASVVSGLRDEVQWYDKLPEASHLNPPIGAVP